MALPIAKRKACTIAAVTLCLLVNAGLAYGATKADTEKGRAWHEYDPVGSGETQQWFEDAKLGIFIHWGIYSVPAYAPVDNEPEINPGLLKLLWIIIKNGGLPETSYSEWYKSNLSKSGSDTERFHNETYGADFDYYDFAPMFNQSIKQWDPVDWAKTFRKAGAKYVVLTSKHHDGFTLWPSAYPSARIPEGKRSAVRDIVGELTDAVRSENLHMGLYFSGGIDWSYAASHDFSPLGRHTYPSDFVTNTDRQLQEIIDKYRPDILWNDIGYPTNSQVTKHIQRYRSLVPGGIINNRWRDVPTHQVKPDFGTPEYAIHSETQPFKWEASRGLGYSYGYNRMDNEDTTLSRKELVHLLIDIVSKNGNLLLNIGPKSDGSIPAIQLDRLKALGKWLSVNGDAIYGTRPWLKAEGSTLSGIPIRYTKKEDSIYAILMGRPSTAEVSIRNLKMPEGSTLRLLTNGEELKWRTAGDNIVVSWPKEVAKDHAYALEFRALQ